MSVVRVGRQLEQQVPADGRRRLQNAVDDLKSPREGGVGLRIPGQKHPPKRGVGRLPVRRRRFRHQSGQQARGLRQQVRVPGQHFQGPEQVGLVLLGRHRPLLAAKHRQQGPVGRVQRRIDGPHKRLGGHFRQAPEVVRQRPPEPGVGALQAAPSRPAPRAPFGDETARAYVREHRQRGERLDQPATEIIGRSRWELFRPMKPTVHGVDVEAGIRLPKHSLEGGGQPPHVRVGQPRRQRRSKCLLGRSAARGGRSCGRADRPARRAGPAPLRSLRRASPPARTIPDGLARCRPAKRRRA